MDKYCVKWDDFGGNITEYSKMLKETQRLFDVTFLTEDGVHIQAHKIILSTSSDFLRDIFREIDASSIDICLKGINSVELERVLTFIYSGEALIAQKEVYEFVETCKVLQLKGLNAESTNNVLEEKSRPVVQRLREQENQYSKTNCGTIQKKPSVKGIKTLGDVFTHKDSNVIEVKSENLQVGADHALDLQIQEMIEKHDRQWNCKVCGKTSAYKQDIKNHVETHFKGIVHACELCAKSFSTRKNLRYHVNNIHSELFDCEDCGKSGMTRNAYKIHRRKQHF